jgi:signal peptidase II
MTQENSPSSRDYRWLLWVVAALVFGLDQWSKSRIIEWLDFGETWRPLAGTPILELFAFTHIKNTGAAFGMFQTGGAFFIVIAIVVSLFIVFYTPRIPRARWLMFIALGLELGGATGNLIDRLRLGWVTDFVHIGSFAIFNVADSAVVSGVVLLFFLMWRDDEATKRAQTATDAPHEGRDVRSLNDDPTPSES